MADAQSSWTTYGPNDARAKTAPSRPVVARITVDFLSATPGDSKLSLWVDPNGPLSAAGGSQIPLRAEMISKLQQLASTDIRNRLGRLDGH